jgi:hypothetical protein
MKKSLPKLTLFRETLRRLDESRLENAAGGAIQGGGGSMDRTCQSLCFVCPETWPVETGVNNR